MSELIIIAHNEEAKKIEPGESDLSADEFMIYTNDLWFISPETDRELHPAPFPIEIPSRLIKLYTWKNDVILDPFVGKGTTAMACLELQRKFIGIDISQKYCDISTKEIEKAKRQLQLW